MGRQLKLKKVYRELWQKKRGSATKTFTGHTTDYFIDDVPTKKKEFDDAIASICDESIFKLLTNPRYFNEILHWQDRRKMLIQVCGDITDADVIASDPGLKDLPGILGKHKLEDLRKIIAARRVEINRELEKIPVRIDEIKGSAVKDLPALKAVKADIVLAQERLKKAQGILSELKNGGEAAVLRTKLREIESQIIKIDNETAVVSLERQKTRNAELLKLSHAITDIEMESRNKEGRRKSLVTAKETSEVEITVLERDMKTLRDKWTAENAKEFTFEQSSTCPTCGQSLPEEKLIAARETALAAFNQEKAERLSKITEAGKSKKTTWSEKHQRLNELEKEIKAADDSIRDLKKSLEAAEIDLQAAKENTDMPDPENPERSALVGSKTAIEQQIANLKAGLHDSLQETKTEIGNIETEIGNLQKIELQHQANARIEVRIDELKKQERALSGEYEKLEKELYLTEQFVRTKVKLLEEKINSKFELARFQLFTQNINGGLEECCNTTYRGVPYASMNNAARINIGLDICNTLAEHFGKWLPLFIDNAEAVSRIHPTPAQQIRLIVSPNDKTLRIEGGTE